MVLDHRAGAVTTGPTVTISSANGTTGAPVNTNVVAVASALLDPNTITNNSITVTPNGSTTAVPGTVTLAADLVTLTWVPTSNLTVSTTYNIQVGGFTDQNGNAVTGASSFSTGTNGTPIGANSLVVSTITPSNIGAVVQIYLDQTVTDVNSVPLRSVYTGSFTVARDPASVGPNVVNTNPTNGETGVPSNPVVQVQFDQALDGTTVNGANVTLLLADTTPVGGTVSLVGTNIVQFVPSSALTGGTYYYLNFNNVKNASGTLLATSYYVYFQTGTATDATTPSVAAAGPPDMASGVGTNTAIHVLVSKALDPVSVNGSTIQVTSASQTVIPTSISFGRTHVASPAFDTVAITPQAPLPAGTAMTITINPATINCTTPTNLCVTDPEGHAVPTKVTHFTMAFGPDFPAPTVVYFSA